ARSVRGTGPGRGARPGRPGPRAHPQLRVRRAQHGVPPRPGGARGAPRRRARPQRAHRQGLRSRPAARSMTATATTTTLPRRGFARGLGREFNLLWLGQSVSNVGDRINLFVVPAVMILLLHASAFQVGLVGMAQYLAIPLLSLVAGVLVDRWTLRTTLVWCDVIRCAVVAAIPVAWWLGVLSVPLVFVCVAVANATS